ACSGQASTSTSYRTAILPNIRRRARKREVASVIFRCLRRSTEAAVCSIASGRSLEVERTSTITSVSPSSASKSSSPAGYDTFDEISRYPNSRRKRAAPFSLRLPNHRFHPRQREKPPVGGFSFSVGGDWLAIRTTAPLRSRLVVHNEPRPQGSGPNAR